MNAIRRRTGVDVSLALLVLVQFAVLVWLGSVLNTSRDEEYTMGTTAHGPLYAAGRAISYELQAPLYFICAAIWREINPSLVFLRGFSALITAGTTIVVFGLARRLWPARPPIWFALAYAVSPFVVSAGVDVRAYAMALGFVALAGLAFVDGWWFASDRRARILFIVWGIGAVFTQYYVAFVFVGLAIALFAAGRFRACVSYICYAIVIAIALLGLVHVVAAQFAGYDFTPRPLSLEVSDTLREPWREFVFPQHGLRGFGVSKAAYGLLSVTVLTLMFGVAQWRRASVRATFGLVAGIEACYLLAATLLHVVFESPRHYLDFELPTVVLYGAVVIDEPSRRRTAGLGLAAVYLFTAAAASVFACLPLATYGDWHRVGTFVAARVRPADRVAVFEPDAVPAFQRYFDAPEPVVPFPHAVDPNRYDADALRVHSEAEADTALRRLTAGGAHVWLAIDCRYGHDDDAEGCLYLQRAIDRHFPQRGQTDFFGAWVAELPRPRVDTLNL